MSTNGRFVRTKKYYAWLLFFFFTDNVDYKKKKQGPHYFRYGTLSDGCLRTPRTVLTRKKPGRGMGGVFRRNEFFDGRNTGGKKVV